MTVQWKKLLVELESITKGNGRAAWRTAQIVRELWSSAEFLEASRGKMDRVENRLQKFSGRFALGLNDMIQMIEHFPDVKDWQSGRLDVLRDETCKQIMKKTREEHKVVTRNSVSLRQYEELKKKYRKALQRIRELEKQITAMQGKGRGA